ncbi:Co2+/Mg2+ efflux protein ApaG [Litoribrevibacter euphylliae]|uniref:Protein ApaG n=1 Tax=Litoribrevibacter euphylliae TaxID=1834034 RepID=A0ABV7HGI6_9GAMM
MSKLSNADKLPTSDAISIHVITKFVEEQSDPAKERFVFAYTISITNNGDEPAQLLSRYWKIIDGNEQVHEVEGEGVVGQKPNLAPGEDFTYTSGTAIATPVGAMEGYYIFEREDGTQFVAPIAPFRLAHSAMIH